MGSPKKTTPTSPPSRPAPVVSFPDQLWLKLERDAQINVTLAPTDQPARPLNPRLRILFYVVAGVGLVWFLLYFKYIAPQTYASVALSGTTLSAVVTHHGYAAFGDVTELDLTITNLGADPFSGQVTICFKGKIPIQPLPSESTTLKLEPLAPGASATQRVKFSLGQQIDMFSDECLHTELQATSGNQQFRASILQPILIAAIPYPRTLHDWLRNSVLSAAVAVLLWEVIRKRFFGWEAKG